MPREISLFVHMSLGLAVIAFVIARLFGRMTFVFGGSGSFECRLSEFVRNIEIRRFPDTSKNASKTDGWSKFLLVFSMQRGKSSGKSGIKPIT